MNENENEKAPEGYTARPWMDSLPDTFPDGSFWEWESWGWSDETGTSTKIFTRRNGVLCGVIGVQPEQIGALSWCKGDRIRRLYLIPKITAVDELKHRLAQSTPRPSPRPASELTPERLAAWPDWMIAYPPFRAWENVTSKFFGAGVSRYSEMVTYPIRPDLTNGPIPATWEELDAAVATRAEPRETITWARQMEAAGRELAEMLSSMPGAMAGTTISGGELMQIGEAVVNRIGSRGEVLEYMSPGHTDLMVTPESIPDYPGESQGPTVIRDRRPTQAEALQVFELEGACWLISRTGRAPATFDTLLSRGDFCVMLAGGTTCDGSHAPGDVWRPIGPDGEGLTLEVDDG